MARRSSWVRSPHQQPTILTDILLARITALLGYSPFRAGVAHARVLAIAISDLVTAAAAIRAARGLNPRLRIIALADSSAAVQALEALGANDVVQPEFEASMGFVRQALRWLGMAAPAARVVVVGERHAFYDHDHPERTRSDRDASPHRRPHADRTPGALRAARGDQSAPSNDGTRSVMWEHSAWDPAAEAERGTEV
jgi:TrkA family protein